MPNCLALESRHFVKCWNEPQSHSVYNLRLGKRFQKKGASREGNWGHLDLGQNRKVLEVAAHASCVHCVSLLVLYTNPDISQHLRYSKRVKPVWIYKFGPVSTDGYSLVWPFKRHANALNPTGWAVVLFLYTSSSFASAYNTVSSIMAEYYVYVINTLFYFIIVLWKINLICGC